MVVPDDVMTQVIDHIKETKYLLNQMLESGFLSGRGFDQELSQCKETAYSVGLDTGGELLEQLSAIITTLRANQGDFSEAASIFSTLIAYYDFVTNKLIIETII